MIELPELREALRDTAERRYGRRRRRIRPRLVAAVALACVGAGVFAVRPASPPEREITATPTPAPSVAPPAATFEDARAALASVYGVFRRPAKARDRVEPEKTASRAAKIEMDWAGARRIARSGKIVSYAIPAVVNGKVGLCTRTLRNGIGGGGCGEFDPAAADDRPSWGKTFYRPGAIYFLMLPDGVESVRVELKDGRTYTEPVDENGVVFHVQGFRSVSWTGTDGVRHVSRMTI